MLSGLFFRTDTTMAFSNRSGEAFRLARERAAITGGTLSQAVTVALRERQERVQREQAARDPALPVTSR
jgi:hypothetical protein